jgi:hypothetical protein
MKATVLYCDRCVAEGKPEVRASLIVWIRTSLGGRTVRLDVCSAHFAVMVGQPASANGAEPAGRSASAPEREWSPRGGGGKMQAAYNRALGYAAKHARFSFEDVAAALGKEIPSSRLGFALRMLVDDKKLERYMMGVYQHPGFHLPQPSTVELATSAALKLIKALPGIRGPMVAALCGIESHKLWKATLAELRERKLIRTKGDKSGMQMWAL